MPKAYSYIRFSSSKQELGDSYRRQLDASRKWIASKDGVWEAEDHPTIQDLGVSAYTGANLDPISGGLGKFLELCESGLIDKGSYLIIESLDRFSRAEPIEAAALISKIIRQYKLKIVKLNPYPVVLTVESLKDQISVIGIVMELCAAHSYSVALSTRLKDDWSDRRKEVRGGKQFNTLMVPSWMDVERTGEEKNYQYKITPNKKKIKLIQKIFEMVQAGTSQRAIVKYLNENHEPIARRTNGDKKNCGIHWSHSYVSRLLKDRRLLGEMQFNKKNEMGDLIPDGEVLKEYYPEVISPDLFYAVQSSKERHKRFKKPAGKTDKLNILKGLVTGPDGYKMYMKSGVLRRKSGYEHYYYRLQSYGYKTGKSKYNLTVDYLALEGLVLDCLSELRTVDVESVKPRSKEIKEIESVIRGIEIRQKEIQRRLNDDKYIDEYRQNLDLQLELKRKHEHKQSELDNLRSIEPRNSKEIIRDLNFFRPKSKNKDEKRKLETKYLQIIPEIVKSIFILPVKIHNSKNCAMGFIRLRNNQARFFILNKDEKVKDAIYTDEDGNPMWLYTTNGHVFWQRTKEIHKIVGKLRRGGASSVDDLADPADTMKKLQELMRSDAKKEENRDKPRMMIEWDMSIWAIYSAFSTDEEKKWTTVDGKTSLVDDEGVVWDLVHEKKSEWKKDG